MYNHVNEPGQDREHFQTPGNFPCALSLSIPPSPGAATDLTAVTRSVVLALDLYRDEVLGQVCVWLP